MKAFLPAVLLGVVFASPVAASSLGGDSEAELLASQGDRVLMQLPQGVNDDDDDAPSPAYKAPAPLTRSQMRDLEEKTDDYYFSKHVGATCAIAATVLSVGGLVVISSMGTEDVTAADGAKSSRWTTAGDVGGIMFISAAPFYCVGAAEIVVAVVRGIKLRHYEREVGYRFSVAPVYDPRTRSSGALARLDF